MMRTILAGGCLVAHDPLFAGLTLITAVNDATGDYESIKTIEAVTDKAIRIRYSAQKMDYGVRRCEGVSTV